MITWAALCAVTRWAAWSDPVQRSSSGRSSRRSVLVWPSSRAPHWLPKRPVSSMEGGPRLPGYPLRPNSRSSTMANRTGRGADCHLQARYGSSSSSNGSRPAHSSRTRRRRNSRHSSRGRHHLRQAVCQNAFPTTTNSSNSSSGPHRPLVGPVRSRWADLGGGKAAWGQAMAGEDAATSSQEVGHCTFCQAGVALQTCLPCYSGCKMRMIA